MKFIFEILDQKSNCDLEKIVKWYAEGEIKD